MSNFKKIFIAIICVGSIGVCMNMIFGDYTMVYLYQETIANTNMQWYRIDTLAYINNIYYSISKLPTLAFIMPTRQWMHFTMADLINWNLFLANNLAVMLNFIIIIINAILYPMRAGAYAFNILCALIGLNIYDSRSSIKWMGDFTNALMNTQVPYI